MTLWIDAQLSPALASWITTTFPSTDAVAVRDIGLRDADDMEIFRKGKKEGSIILTKDEDFVRIVQHYGPPPQVIWLTCGNTSNAVLKEILTLHLEKALSILATGEALVEIK